MTQEILQAANATAKDLMTKKVMALEPDMPVLDALAELGDDHVGGAPVIGAGGRVLGVFSIQDVARNANSSEVRLMAESMRARGDGSDDDDGDAPFDMSESQLAAYGSARVADWMSTDVASVTADTQLLELCRAFVDANVHRLVVLQSGSLIGIVSTMDVVRHLAG